MYDEAAVSSEFRALAEKADTEFNDLQRNPGGAHAADRDYVLARSCVYGYLYERHFLESPKMLLNELRWLRQTGRPRAPRAPRQALDLGRFQAARDALLDALIARFEAERSA